MSWSDLFPITSRSLFSASLAISCVANCTNASPELRPERSMTSVTPLFTMFSPERVDFMKWIRSQINRICMSGLLSEVLTWKKLDNLLLCAVKGQTPDANHSVLVFICALQYGLRISVGHFIYCNNKHHSMLSSRCRCDFEHCGQKWTNNNKWIINSRCPLLVLFKVVTLS